MATFAIELRSGLGYGESFVLEIPVPDKPEQRILDKPWPKMAPLPLCRLILCHGCGTDFLHRFDNSLFQAQCKTLEQACFEGLEAAVYDGLDDHQNFRSVRRRHRQEDYIALTMDNQIIWLRTKTNKMREIPRVMEKWTIPERAQYVYIGAVEYPAQEHIGRYLFDVDERNLHRRLLRMAKNSDSFEFLKLSTQYAHASDYRFYAVYYPGDYISPEDQAVIDALNAFPKDDPLAFYDECMKHVPGEAYLVDRDGNRTCSRWTTTHLLGKGIADFLNPETYHKMTRFKTNTYEWERYSSDMQDDVDFGNIYE